MIRTIEDGFQYRMHHVLNKFKEDFDTDKASGFLDESISFEDYITVNSRSFTQAVLDDIDTYCGLDECIENQY